MSTSYRVMGVVNVTPDSFSDGGLYLEPAAAIAHALELEAQGADILDVGGESTRPGAEPVSAQEELRRVLPMLEGLAQAGTGRARLSIDTSKASVAAAAIATGVEIVNDVSALRFDGEMAGLVASSGVECCLMHMLGDAAATAQVPHYDDVVDEVRCFLEQRLSFAVAQGIAEERIMLDPGIGFGKTAAQNFELLRRLNELVAIGRPIVIGTSRKRFLGRVLEGLAPRRDGPAGASAPASARLPGTIATNVLALERGASVFRVHDVAAVRAALATAAATLDGRWIPSARTLTS